MDKVYLIARIVAKPGKVDELRSLLAGMLAPTHAEPGCEIYDLHETPGEGRFYFYELWRDRSALDEHFAAPHFKNLQEKIDELIAEPVEINITTAVKTS